MKRSSSRLVPALLILTLALAGTALDAADKAQLDAKVVQKPNDKTLVVAVQSGEFRGLWSLKLQQSAAGAKKGQRRNPPAPFGLRAAQAPLRRCWRSTMPPHRRRASAWHRHLWCPQRDPVYFHHGLPGTESGSAILPPGGPGDFRYPGRPDIGTFNRRGVRPRDPSRWRDEEEIRDRPHSDRLSPGRRCWRAECARCA